MDRAVFLSELDDHLVREATGLFARATWCLRSDLAYRSVRLGRIIIVPAGFTTDFASVPRVGLAYTIFGDRFHRSAVVHDYLYSVHACSQDAQPVSRWACDGVLFEAVRCEGYSGIFAAIVWAAVRCGGWLAWRGHAKKHRRRGHNHDSLNK